MVAETFIQPRIQTWERGDEKLGQQAVAFCRRHGMTLDPEQEFVLAKSFTTRSDGRWANFEVGVNEPRQNGKGEILIGRELFGMYELHERYGVHTAHEFKTSERHFARVEETIRQSSDLLDQVKRTAKGRIIGFRFSHGDEAIELADGRSLEFRTRTKSGMRGFEDVALLVLDEAMILGEPAHGSMMPTVRASKAPRGPQLWYAGSAVDQMSQEQGIVWARIRERGIAGAPDLAYFEWSLEYDQPEDVPEDVLSDPANWRKVNVAIERGRVLEEHMYRELASMPRRAFIVELLGVGDWPATDGRSDLVISDEQWGNCQDQHSKLVDPICLAFDVSPDRRSSISAAGYNEEGKWHIEVLQKLAGTSWLPGRLAELDETHQPLEIVCDGYGPSNSLVHAIEQQGVKLRRTDSRELAQACGHFVDAVASDELRHLGSLDLWNALRGAATRPLVDSWAWSRKNSTVDISPLVSCTLALWSATDLVPKNLGELVVF